jgi:hypothetical protein
MFSSPVAAAPETHLRLATESKKPTIGPSVQGTVVRYRLTDTQNVGYHFAYRT